MADKPQFQLHIKGVDLAPETVRASDLAALLVHLEGAIVETAKGQQIPLAYEDQEVLVSLVHLEHGNSNDTTWAVASPISPAVSTMTQVVLDRRFTFLPVPAQKHLHELSIQAISKRWAYEFHESNGLLVAPAVISYEFPVPKPTAEATISGPSSIWGHLTKVGGDQEPKASLRLRNGRLFTVLVTKQMVVELFEHNLIYKDIGLEGLATWNPNNWELKTFRATSVLPYRPDETTLTESFRELGRASNGRWDNVDPVAFVERLRYE